MTVGLIPQHAKKKDAPDTPPPPPCYEVGVKVPRKRRRVTVGTMVVMVGAGFAMLVAAGGLGYLTYWGIEQATGRQKEARVHCDLSQKALYDRPLHGRRARKHHEQPALEESESGSFFDYWLNILQGEEDFVEEFREWFKVAEDVWKVVVAPYAPDMGMMSIVTDLGSNHSAVRVDLMDGFGERCLVLHSKYLSNEETMEAIESFIEDQEFHELDIQEIFTEFFAVGARVQPEDNIGDAIREMCQGVGNMNYLVDMNDPFRRHVADLMREHDVTYDDMYEVFVNLEDAMYDYEGTLEEIWQLLEEFTEVVGFLPDGTYGTHYGPNGMGWSLNVWTSPLPRWMSAQGEVTYFDVYLDA